MTWLHLLLSMFVSTIIALIFAEFCGIAFGTWQMGVLLGVVWFIGAFITLFSRYGRF